MCVWKWDCDGGEGWSGKRKKPLTEKSTNVSMKEDRRLGTSLQNDVVEGLLEFDKEEESAAVSAATMVVEL